MKISAVFTAILVATAGLGAIGIASAASNRPGENVKPGRDRSACFDPSFIRGFQTPDNNTLVIISGRNEAYEVKLGGACIGLDNSMFIGVKARYGMNDICGPFDGDIIYEGISGRREVCPITRVRHLEGEEAAEYIHKPLKDGKKKEKAAESGSSGNNW